MHLEYILTGDFAGHLGVSSTSQCKTCYTIFDGKKNNVHEFSIIFLLFVLFGTQTFPTEMSTEATHKFQLVQ